jgi:putative hydrolase of the HAD superfamily
LSDLVIALDADDTLWHNEPLFTRAQERFRAILARYPGVVPTDADLYARESRNIRYFGYGSKGFALSLIETAIEVTDGEIVGRDVQAIVDIAKEILDSPLELLDGAAEVVAMLARSYRLLLVTKGDALEQESKGARSGLAECFTAVEIVGEKDEATYQRVFARHNLDVARVLMVGNSLRSDVLPVIRLGGLAAHVPYPTTWLHEVVPPEEAAEHRYFELDSLRDLPSLVARIASETARS